MKNGISESASVALYRPAKFNPLPGTITSDKINHATLPVKIETARRAIAACTDLPELLQYRDQAEGLAAAVRTMKHVGPEMIRHANELMADAWRKGGELLSQYSNVSKSNPVGGNRGGSLPSPRRKIANQLGIKPFEANRMVRIANAPKSKVYQAVQSSKSLSAVAQMLPKVDTRERLSSHAYSDPMRNIMGTAARSGLARILGIVQTIDLALFKTLPAEERKIVKGKIVEIVEILDEMDRLCK